MRNYHAPENRKTLNSETATERKSTHPALATMVLIGSMATVAGTLVEHASIMPRVSVCRPYNFRHRR